MSTPSNRTSTTRRSYISVIFTTSWTNSLDKPSAGSRLLAKNLLFLKIWKVESYRLLDSLQNCKDDLNKKYTTGRGSLDLSTFKDCSEYKCCSHCSPPPGSAIWLIRMSSPSTVIMRVLLSLSNLQFCMGVGDCILFAEGDCCRPASWETCKGCHQPDWESLKLIECSGSFILVTKWTIWVASHVTEQRMSKFFLLLEGWGMTLPYFLLMWIIFQRGRFWNLRDSEPGPFG